MARFRRRPGEGPCERSADRPDVVECVAARRPFTRAGMSEGSRRRGVTGGERSRAECGEGRGSAVTRERRERGTPASEGGTGCEPDDECNEEQRSK